MLALVVTLAFAAGAAAEEPAPAVVILPLLADGSVSIKQANGVTAMLRTAVESGQVAKLLATTGDDDKQAQKCQRDLACLGGIADLRGADLLVGGIVIPGPDGLQVSIVVVKPKAKDAFRRGDITLQGDEGDTARVDRLVRTALNPKSLQGKIHITGEEGASVELDGKIIGTLPLDDIEHVSEGQHTIVVRKAGYEDLHRSVSVVHAQTVALKAVLLGARDPSVPLLNAPHADAAPSHTDAVVVGSIGAGLLVLGGVAGAFSLRDSLDAENRAKAQQLAFPDDAGLMSRGQILAYSADGLYAVAALAGIGAGVLWLTDTAP